MILAISLHPGPKTYLVIITWATVVVEYLNLIDGLRRVFLLNHVDYFAVGQITRTIS